ncbi:MAG: radical SAM family heme chaperone HemW [Candidatus Cloacimonetes bacterium]|nr:radical SAM family heme chaperone HemW [Candidatus Cloacimonadota bacterium]
MNYNISLLESFIKQIKNEITYYKNYYNFKPHSIYFGGGTPSLMPVKQLDEIIQLISNPKQSSVKEITIEINPYKLSNKLLKEYSQIGINRYSFGIQSMINSELKILGRLHNNNDISKLYSEQLLNNNYNFSYDIIYGLPNQTLSDLEITINELLKIPPSHFSIYCLSLEKDVPLYKEISNIPNDETLENMYFTIKEKLESANYLQYELSSFAKNNNQSIHNTAYWSDKYYIGLGPSASGYLPSFRYTNINNVENYCNIPINNIQSITEVSTSEHQKEYIITGLRKTKGIEIKQFNHKFNTDFKIKYSKEITTLLKNNLIIVNDEYIKINPKYYFISNEVLCEFI